jgi:hypothetical protein
MNDFDYKKYSLEKLQEWVHDALSSGEASPHEIYSAIREAVREDYYCYKDHASRSYGLLELLSGHRPVKNDDDGMRPWGHSDLEYQIANQDKILSCDKDDPSPECQESWNNFWDDVDKKHSREYNLREAEYYNQRVKLDAEYEVIKAAGGYEWTPSTIQDKVNKWRLPVEIDGVSGEYFVQFPDDLLEAVNLKEGDQVEWVDQGDGSYLLKKV